ncbi:MAG: hypothetical protein PHF86_07505 [Candidatus Nanoarchaeia archaeon]|jgi:hypothetical protein|nr:hypothetical protein [Candidatus Nanoarchaeia archaeon]
MLRYFKCNVLGGFRLTDLNKKVALNEYFSVDAYVCDASKSVKAALKSNWATEISEEEFLNKQEKKGDLGEKCVSVSSTTNKLVINAKEVNKKIESRQAGKTFKKQPMQKQKIEEKPSIPNFKEVEKRIKERQQDVTTKGNDEVLPSPVEKVVKDLVKDVVVEKLSIPDFNEKKEIKDQVSEEIKKKIVRKSKKISSEKVRKSKKTK